MFQGRSRLLQYFSKTWANSGGRQGTRGNTHAGRKRRRFKHLDPQLHASRHVVETGQSRFDSRRLHHI